MKIERGMEAEGLRLRLIIQSEDVRAHSAMGDNAEAYSLFADDLSEVGRKILRERTATLVPPVKP